MTKTVLKKKIHEIIDKSDERILKIVYDILQTQDSNNDNTEFLLTDAEVKELDLRWDRYKEGKEKAYTVTSIKKQLKKKKKS